MSQQTAPSASIDAVESATADRPGWFAGYGSQMVERWAHVRGLVVRETEPGARVLHAGCIPPNLQFLVEQSGRKTFGVDVAPGRVDDLLEQLGLTVARVDLDEERVPARGGTFSAVVCSETIEHLLRPARALVEFRRVLDDDGTLVLTTPHYGRLETRARALWGEPAAPTDAELETFDDRGHRGHVRLFGFHELRGVVERAGFDVLRHYRRDFGPSRARALDILYRRVPALAPFQVLVAEVGDR
jgi:SAM-dependent methyltransferase